MSLRSSADGGGARCAGLSGSARCCARWACACGCANEALRCGRRGRPVARRRRTLADPTAPALRRARARACGGPPREPAAAQPRRRAVPGVVPADWLVVGEPFDERRGRGQAGEQERCSTTCCARSASRAIATGAQSTAPATSRSAPGGRQRRCDAALEHGRAALRRSALWAAPRPQALLGVDEPLGRLRGGVHAHDGVRSSSPSRWRTCCAIRPKRRRRGPTSASRRARLEGEPAARS